MSQRALYAVIAILVVAVAVLSFAWYQESSRPAAITVELPNGSISIGEDGVSVKTD
ncbi:MAG: hypothetical protein KKH72_05925 [Alphaproteobacteria bacterium]|nr:hypothetical protein [Alphaproteobacteria bacterium]